MPAVLTSRPQAGLSFLAPEPEDLEDLYSRYKVWCLHAENCLERLMRFFSQIWCPFGMVFECLAWCVVHFFFFFLPVRCFLKPTIGINWYPCQHKKTFVFLYEPSPLQIFDQSYNSSQTTEDEKKKSAMLMWQEHDMREKPPPPQKIHGRKTNLFIYLFFLRL